MFTKEEEKGGFGRWGTLPAYPACVSSSRILAQHLESDSLNLPSVQIRVQSVFIAWPPPFVPFVLFCSIIRFKIRLSLRDIARVSRPRILIAYSGPTP